MSIMSYGFFLAVDHYNLHLCSDLQTGHSGNECWPGIVHTQFFVDDSSNIVFCTNRVHVAATDMKIVGICTE